MTDSIAQLLREAAEKVEESGWSILASDLVQAAASLEAQEPVATVSEESFSNDGTSDIITRNLPIGTTLYRHPPPSAVAQEPSKADLYNDFQKWCSDNPSFDLDSRLHTHGGPIDRGGYISHDKTRLAFSAYRAGRLYRHPPTSAVPELVAIAERLPERGEYVLIVAADRFWNVPDGFPDMNVAAVAYLDDYGAGPFWYTWGRGGATTDSYTHWMLIPAAPQQGGE